MSIFNRQDKKIWWLILFVIGGVAALVGLTNSIDSISDNANYWLGGIGAVLFVGMGLMLFATKKG